MSHKFGTSQKIVIVEDNQALSDIYKTRLELLGYTVFPAYDGVQALAVIEREQPDLVLLDLMIPKIAGDQVLERLRQSDWGKDIKVAIMSNLNEADAPAGLRSLGIEAYAVKANLNNDQLDQLVDAVLKPAGQSENVVLAHTDKPEVSVSAPSTPPDPTAADPLSGTRFQGESQAVETMDQPYPPAAPTVQPVTAPETAALQPDEPADTFTSAPDTIQQTEPEQPAEPAPPAAELPPEEQAL